MKEKLCQFNVGDNVFWESQANGSTKRKEGTICAIVPAKVPAYRCVPENLKVGARRYDGFIRNHESYIVVVPTSRSVVLYWPRVKMLRRKGGR